MATTSPRWGFVLPDPPDQVSITDLNTDTLIVDSALGMTPCTSATRPLTPVNGQVIYETDTHRTYIWDTTGIVGVWYPLGPIPLRLGSNQIANTQASPQAVTDLQLTLQATTSYTLDGFIAYSTDTAADAVLSLTLPAGSTIIWGGDGASSAASGTVGSVELATVTTTSITLGGAGVGVAMMANVRGQLTTSTAVGNIEAFWCQAVSTASNTVLSAGSWLRLQRV